MTTVFLNLLLTFIAFLRRFASFIALSTFILVSLSGCDAMLGSSIKNKSLITLEEFRQMRGYELQYNVYLTSSWLGWEHKEESMFHYNPETQSYIHERIRVGQNEVDTLGSRFKVSSLEWRYQFGFGHHGISLNESTFGLGKEGIVVRLMYSSEGVSDMRVEYAARDYPEIRNKILSFEFKVLDDSAAPDAALYLSVKEPSEVRLPEK